MKKYVESILISIIMIFNCAEILFAGGNMTHTDNKSFYNKLISLEKEKNWKLVGETGERVEPSFKRLFEIYSFIPENIKKLDIGLYKPDQWGSRNIYGFSLSPNGKEIAFVIGEIGVRSANYSTLYSLHILHVEDGKVETILPPRQFPMISRICYAPNGKEIFFVGKINDIKEPNSTHIPQFDSLYQLDLQTRVITELVQYGVWAINTQSCSPDGKKIVYQNNKIDEIYIHDTTTNLSSKLVDGKFPTWMPTGEKIAYCGKDNNYYIINLDGSDNRLFVLNEPKDKFKLFGEKILGISGELLWSPDGQYIYYERIAVTFLADVEHHVPYIMNVTTKEEIRLPARFDGIKSWVGQNLEIRNSRHFT